MKFKKLIKKNYFLFIIVLFIILSPVLFTFAKYVIEKSGIFNFNLKGVAFNAEGLETVSDIDFTESTDLLLNPERGFYEQLTHTLSNPYSEDDKNLLLQEAGNITTSLSNDNLTLALTMFYLTNYKTENLSSQWLSALDEYCNVLRENGYKTIIRFAYDSDPNGDPSDFDQILKHMDQLSSFFNTNSDIILAVQLGFIGEWGEWHSTDFTTTDTYRKQIIAKALDVVPAPTQILVRRPYFYKEYFGTGYFDTKVGFTNVNEARVGIYNDGYLSTITDYGTYETTDREEELKWMNYLTQYTFFGGETIYTDEGYFDVDSATNDMSKTHITFLNNLYSSDVIDLWKNTNITDSQSSIYSGLSAYTYFANRLGYRYVLSDSKMPSYDVGQGEYLHFSFNINNTGFNNLIYERPVNIILEKDGKYYQTSTNVDPRGWKSGEDSQTELVFKIPGNIDPGSWNVYVQLPDSSDSLTDNDNYYIKFANNNNLYEPVLHANYLGNFNVIENTNSTDNGFYQVNTINIEDDPESELKTLDRYTIIDGKKTTPTEWRDDDLVYSVGSDSIYLRADDEYIYFYSETDVDLQNFHILFSTDESISSQTFNYIVENYQMLHYNNGFDGYICQVEQAVDTGFEYKIPISELNISSLDELRAIKLQYLDANWSIDKEIYVELKQDEIVVDGEMTFTDEYTENDIFYTEGTSKIYARIQNDYLYVYAEDSSLSGDDLTNPSIYLGSNDKTITSDSNGYMIWYETYPIRKCDTSGCNTNINDYSPLRGIGSGVEFKIPIEVINISNVSDIRKLKILYRNSSWAEIKTVTVSIRDTVYPEDVVGKTVIYAKKPSDWDDIYIYLYNSVTTPSWPPTELMPKYVDGSDDMYAYILPDDFEYYYVLFTGNSLGTSQYPFSNENLFRIENGKSKIWDGTQNSILSWQYYDSSQSTSSNIINFKLEVPTGYSDYGCAYLYHDAGEISAWPGVALTKEGEYWQGSITLSGTYTNLRIIYNNCNNGWQYPSTDGIIIRPGITIGYYNNSFYIESD